DRPLDQLVAAATSDPPFYLRDLGEPPRAAWARHTWRRAIRNVEAYRAEHDVTNPYATFGDRATDPADIATWRDAIVSFAIDCDSIETARRSAGQGQERDHGVEIEL